MSTIHLTQTTTATPEQFVAALTDFGPDRSKLFGRSADAYLKVHHQGPGKADPNRIEMRTTDSNVWGGRSGHTYTLTRQPGGKTDIDVVVVRDGKNIKGRVLGGLLRVVGKRVLGGELAKTVKAIEARNGEAPATEPR